MTPSKPAEPTGVRLAGLRAGFGGARVLHDLDLEVRPGEVMALLGPSGCGKTTLLRVVAGLHDPEAGTVEVGGAIVSGEGAPVAPEDRGVGMVFQDWAVFPHMDVASNVGFGLPRGERRRSPRIDETLRLVGLEDLASRRPATLSGGQQQRVALGRALAPRPSVLLMDEPFSNLDASLRARVRSDVRSLLGEVGLTCILVTHDRDEAFVLGDRVAVMHSGRIAQIGTPVEVYTRPADDWVAALVGEVAALPGRAAGLSATTALGEVVLNAAASGEVRVLVRPEQLVVGSREGDGAEAVVTAVEYHGPSTVYRLSVEGPDLPALAASMPGTPVHSVGDRVRLVVLGELAAVGPPAAGPG